MPKYKLMSYVLTKGIDLATHGAILRRWLGSLCSLHPAFAAFETFTPQKIAIFEKKKMLVTAWNHCSFTIGFVAGFLQVPWHHSLERTLWNAGLHAGSVERRRATFCPSIDLSGIRLSLGIRKLHQSENGNSKSQHLLFKVSNTSQWKSLKPWRRMILQACWRICSVVLSRHPGFRYWWPKRPLQCRAETRAGTLENQQIRWWGRFGCWTRTCCPCRVNRHRFIVLESGDVPAEWHKTLFTMIPKTMRAKKLSFYCFHPYFLQNCCFHVTSSHGPDSRQPTAGRTTRMPTALQANTYNRCKRCYRQVFRDQQTNLDCEFGPVKSLDRNNWVALWLSLRDHGISQHLVWAVRCLYSSQEGQVVGNSGNSRGFAINAGVRQRCVLSPNVSHVCSAMGDGELATTGYSFWFWCGFASWYA